MAVESPAPFIELNNVVLELPVRSKLIGQTDSSIGQVGGRFLLKGSRLRRIRILDDVSFLATSGMSVGIIGLNGSGKSSLLRLIAGIYVPIVGSCIVNGAVTTLFSNQLGMNANATGAENVRLLSLLLGMDDQPVDELIEEVADFSELGDYMNLPIRTYSAGMRTRISFGVATSGAPEILLVDEVFGTGDQSFMDKARSRMRDLIDRSGVVVLASHSVELLKQYCTHLLWLDRGSVMGFGETEEVLREYRAA